MRPLLTALGRVTTSPLFKRFEKSYSRLFSIDEIREQPVLQWMFGASLLFFFLVFSYLITTTIATDTTAGSPACWPYFQNCSDFFFLRGLDDTYSRSIFYMVFYAVMLLAAWCMAKKRWSAAHALLALLFVWETLVVFVFSYSTNAPYHYYHIFLTAILLFIPNKEFFLKLTFVFLYFMSATTKIDSTWILGTYFSALKAGLPIFPDALIPVLTNIVILSQIVGAWFLLSSHKILQRTALLFFAFFHLYSGVFVYYFYPTISLTSLLILFGPLYRPSPVPLSFRSLTGWTLILLIAAFQLIGFIVPERRLTLEGDRFGMFMFEANHQCAITASTYSSITPVAMYFEKAPGIPCRELYCNVLLRVRPKGDGSVRTERWESGSSLYRCDPYEWWARFQKVCRDPRVQRIAVQFDHSINGGPFYRIVNTENICDLVYKPFVHNTWIHVPPQAPIVGYPVKDVYHY
ncbi:hypothetical protein K8R03_01700 [Candidatus Kaiserbacteria bacterium]|nr:hypothetical protein [Candidatus Kaiserbacteria bacterium]